MAEQEQQDAATGEPTDDLGWEFVDDTIQQTDPLDEEAREMLAEAEGAEKPAAEPPAAKPPATAKTPAKVPADDETAEQAQPAKAPESADPAKAEADAPESPEAAATPDAADDAVPEYPAWEFRADGAAHVAPGSLAGSNGVFFPNGDPMRWLQQRLATAHHHDHQWRDMLARAKAEGEQLLQTAKAKEAAADVIVQQMTELATRGEDEAWEWFQQFRSKLPTLLAQAEKAQVAAERDSLKQVQDRQTAEQEQQRLRAQIDTALDRLVEHYGAQEEFKGVDPQQVRQRLGRLLPAIVYQDDAGEYMVNYGVVEDEFRLLAKASAAPAKAVGQANQQQVTHRESKAPPSVAASRGKQPGSKLPAVPNFKNKKEMLRWLEGSDADRHASELLKTLE